MTNIVNLTAAWQTAMAGEFWYWINERHQIWVNRSQRKPWPWTKDPILQTYRFCNVFRELDTVTQWIDVNIRQPYAQNPNLWLMLAIARQINLPASLAALMEPPEEVFPPRRKNGILAQAWPEADWDLDRQEYAAQILDWRRDQGHQIYTGAYMIRAESDRKKEWYSWSKQRYMTRIVLGRVWEARGLFKGLFEQWASSNPEQGTWTKMFCQPSLQDVHEWFLQFHGWGGFMAYEVVTDLRHTRYLKNAPDIMTWANAGPGAVRGLNRLAGRPLKYVLKQADACAEMQQLLHASRLFVGDHVPPLELRDIEHSLCETDKYLRVKFGEGHPRSKYTPPK